MSTIREQIGKEINAEVGEPDFTTLLAELEEKGSKVEVGRLTLEKSEGAPGDTINFQGNLIVPKDPSGKYTVKLSMNSIDLIESEFTVVEGGILTTGEIIDIYTKSFKSTNYWHFADSEYKKSVAANIKQVVKSDEIQNFKYNYPWFDCDDFANALFGALHHHVDTVAMAVFNTWVWWKKGIKVLGHAIVTFTDGKKVVCVEPQTDAFFSVPERIGIFGCFLDN